MLLVQFYIQIDSAHETVDELGKLGLVQFRDLNPEVNAFQRNFVNEVKRADEMERKLRYFEEQLRKAGEWNAVERPPQIAYQEYIDRQDGDQPIIMDQLEAKLEEIEKELIQLSGNQETLDRNYNELIEMRHVLEKDTAFFGSSEGGEVTEEEKASLLGESEDSKDQALSGGDSGLNFVTGIILRNKVNTFERVLWRAMRGNLFLRQSPINEPIKDPSTGEYEEKNVFIVLFRGVNSEHKIKKLCEAFGANLYPCPSSPEERGELLRDVDQRLADLKSVLKKSQDHSHQMLSKLMSQIQNWKMDVLREKSIYHTMNLFDYDNGRRCLVAEGWCPEEQSQLDKIRAALERGRERSNASVPSVLSVLDFKHFTPPTYYTTNKFTEAFQNLVESYGVARYREINPTVLTIMTFPFLFGVMFGDVGHGFFLLLIGIYLCACENQLGKIKLPEMVDTLFEGRWLFLMMGIFSVYCGFLYNELFGTPMDFFRSNWYYPNPFVLNPRTRAIWGNSNRPPNQARAYPFGCDPLWNGSVNSLDYYNSLKMKMSVILGVTHMSIGIFLSLLNQIHFRDWLSVFYEFFPQMVFLLGLFGFMNSLIIQKWFTDYQQSQFLYDNFSPPRILNLLINMFLTPFTVTWEYKVFKGQLAIQWVLLILLFSSVPVMLLGKPLTKLVRQKLNARRKNEFPIETEADGHDDEIDHFDFGEEFVHQIIHTIEFVLGAVSNTASYLRLWALSLAHSELSLVFWERVLLWCLQRGTFSIILIGFALWCALTVAVLLVMESLSAFLHTLRLHWVESQNKFYKADGYKFTPFSYVGVLTFGEEILTPVNFTGGGH